MCSPASDRITRLGCKRVPCPQLVSPLVQEASSLFASVLWLQVTGEKRKYLDYRYIQYNRVVTSRIANSAHDKHFTTLTQPKQTKQECVVLQNTPLLK